MSIRQLVHRQGKLVHDARGLLARPGAASYETRLVDELLDEAGVIDGLLAQAPDGDRYLAHGGRLVRLKVDTDEHELAGNFYRNQFTKYLKAEGDPDQLGLQVGHADRGGCAVPMALYAGLTLFLDANVHVRRLATVLPPTTAASVRAAGFDTDYGDATWGTEVPASDLSEDDAARTGARELTPHLMTKFIKVSRSLLSAAGPDLENLLIRRLGTRLAITEDKGFCTGSGSQQPLGVFTASPDGVTTSQDVTASSSTAFSADDVINTLFGLPENHLERATWLVGKEFIKRARQLKDASGQYIWRGGLGDQPGLLVGRPVALSAHAPSTYTTGQYVAVVGDFSAYLIQDGWMEIQRIDELLALRKQVGYVARKEVDGMPVIANAFRRLKLA